MQLAQERQPRRGLAVEQHQHDREFRRLHALVEGLVIFEHLPGAEALLADQQHEGVRFVDLLGERRLPEAPGPQARRIEEDARTRILAFDRDLEPLGQSPIRGIETQEPAPHSKHRFKAV